MAGVRAQEIVTLPTRPSVTQSYFLASLPKNPQAVAVLFPGGAGMLRLREENGQIRFSPNNFVVRTRSEFINRGLIAAIVDVPSDLQNEGMNDDFRLGGNHFTDISAVVSDLGKRFPSLPIFLVGTSRGTSSAAVLGARFGSGIAGVVLTSTVFRQTKPGRGNKPIAPGLSQFDFGTIKIPLLWYITLAINARLPLTATRRVSRRNIRSYPFRAGALRNLAPAARSAPMDFSAKSQRPSNRSSTGC